MSGRPRRYFTVARLRLVGFHNFVDETIEIRDGGHLFLLGDNGSGKTTVLDALHYVLCGGQDLELNAAARIGGRRDEGRTVQGIVLRYDAERGVMNEGGGIAYAVAELDASDGGAPLCLGVGTEATTMDARVTKWGIVHHGPLEDLPLVDGERRVTGRDALRDRLGRHSVYGRIDEYRRVLADRLFGGPALYEEVCRFWSMAKAYREIVAGARDFAALFQRLLPAPDPEIFAEILRSLREIDGLEVTLREIEGQRGYVASLVEMTGEIARQREIAARYAWLLEFRRLKDARAAVEKRREQVAQLEAELGRAEALVEVAAARHARADEELRGAESAEGAELLRALREAEARDRDAEVTARGAAAQAAEAARRARAAAEARDGARATLVAALATWVEDLDEALAGASTVPGEHPRARAAAQAVREWLRGVERDAELPAELPTVPEEASAELDAAVARAVDEQATTRVEARVRAEEVAAARERLADLEEAGDERPRLTGWSEARRALDAAGVRHHAVYELIEPAPGADPRRLAALEGLVGEETLGAIVVEEATALGRARAIVSERAPAVRVVVASVDDARLPGWAAELVCDGTRGDAGRRALAAALTQPPSLGEVAAPGPDGTVELRGLAFRVGAAEPRLLGAEARARAHADRLADARRQLSAREAEALAAERAADRAAVLLGRRRDAQAALERIEGRALVRAYAAAREAAQRYALLAETAAQAVAEAERLAAERERAHALVVALRVRSDAADLDELEVRLRELRQAVSRARASLDEAIEGRSDARSRLARGKEEQGEAELEVARLEARLAEAARRLRARLLAPMPEGDDVLERYVRETRRGDQFRTTEAIEEAIRAAERDEQRAVVELEGDGSRGVRHLAHAARFGFAYDRETNRVVDRRGQPAAGILAQLDRELAEQREVVGEKTRRLMDTLVMGALARHLQDQVERLSRMVKDINRLLEGIRFGQTQYRFEVTPRADRRELIDIVRRIAILDDESRRRFRVFIDERLPEITGGGDEVPELLDYRRWYDYRLRMSSGGVDGGVELTRALRVLGSGGEQGVPNYLLVLALAKLMFDNADARVRPLLFDEAFYGIDAGRRDQLLRFATELDLQIFVASPDQDGVTPAVRHATTLLVVKDAHNDVHLAPYHYWNLATSSAQGALFGPPPAEAPADAAECRLPEGGDSPS